MIENWFNIPIYCKNNAFTQHETQQIYNSFVSLKNENKLIHFNGTSLLNYDTSITSILDTFNLFDIKEKIIQYCNEYLIRCKISFNRVVVENNWVIGYNKNEYQGEHCHGYFNNGISGVIYAKVPENSSSIEFITPNPFLEHICVADNSSVKYNPREGMILIFPNFLKHKVMPNLNIPDNAIRLGLSFNALVE